MMKFCEDHGYAVIAFFIVILFYLVIYFFCIGVYTTWVNYHPVNTNSDQWGGENYPGKVYILFDKDTGVYYAVTDKGGITPMYTTKGKIKLVDQGSDTEVHKNNE